MSEVITLGHYSDTIQKRDTTVDRLELQYELLSEAFGFHAQPSFLASPFGKSEITAAQTIFELEDKKPTTSQVIMVNNASRAKHANTGDSKGSDCLWAQIEINWVTHHIVWVDDDIFAFLAHSGRLKKDSSIKRIKWLTYELPNGQTISIEDLSKDTQFRSKDHFPVVQFILEKILQDNGKKDTGEITEGYIGAIFNFGEDFEVNVGELSPFIKWSIADILEIGEQEVTKDAIDGLIEHIGTKLRTTLDRHEDCLDYHVEALEWFEWIHRIQLLWELHNFEKKFGFVPPWIEGKKESLVSHDVLQKYNEERSKLDSNQVLIIDRDKYGNVICAPGKGIDNIDLFIQQNDFSFGEGDYEVVDGQWKILCSIYLTKTISDQTGNNCLWESSSRGPTGEKLFDLNKSIWPDGQILAEVQKLPVGTVLTIRKK